MGLSALTLESVTGSVPGRRLFQNLTYSIEPGRCVCVMGPSGYGKTTLLNMIAGLHKPDQGQIHIGDVNVWSLNDDGRARTRLHRIGFVFQSGELLSEMNVVENVSLPLRLAKVPPDEAMIRAGAALDAVGLSGKHAQSVSTISGGELQRVAIARAIAHEPQVILADEPTGALDETNTHNIADLLLEMCRTRGVAAFVATHDPQLAARFDDTIHLRNWGVS